MSAPSTLTPTIPLGLLEFLSIRSQRGAGDTVRERRDIGLRAVRLADRAGYRRVWVPEHHASGMASTNPLVLLPVLGSLTRSARIGTAVSLLRIRDPHLLAEDLATADHFAPGRIDVGIGRGDAGPGTEALPRHDEAALDDALRIVVELLRDGNDWIDPPDHPVQHWLNGAGTRSAELAAAHGQHYCHALFFNPDTEAARATLAAHAEARPTATRAVAVGLVANRDRLTAAADAAVPGVVINRHGEPARCADLVLDLLADPLIDEVIVTEQSRRAADHLAAVEALAELVTEALPAPAGPAEQHAPEPVPA